MRKVGYWFGVDPGKTTGVALWDAKEKTVVKAHSETFWDAVELLERLHRVLTPEECRTVVFVVETPQLNKPTFAHGQSVNKVREKISRNVGANHAYAELLIEKLEMLGFAVLRVRPKSKKATAEEVKQITGYDGTPNNEHVRDAIMHAYRECTKRGGMIFEEEGNNATGT